MTKSEAMGIFRPDLFHDTTVVVTGGGTGLGQGIALGFARHQAKVAVVARRLDRLEATVEEIRAAGGEGLAVSVDVRDPSSVEAMVDTVEERLGGIDILVNNASALFLAPSEKLTPGGWRAVVETALNGTFYTSSSVARRMIAAQRAGAIVNVVAPIAWCGAPYHAHNGAAKAGIQNLTVSLGLEWAKHGIRVVAIAPGPVHTEGGGGVLWADEALRDAVRESIPLKRFGAREEVAAAVLYLASPAAGYVTGATLVVDGGQQFAWPAWSREELVGERIHREFERHQQERGRAEESDGGER